MTEEGFTLPTNIKQIGSATDGIRIYMEDYVCTYIEQYAHSDKNKEKLGLLIGKSVKVDNDDVLFISGMMQGKFTMCKNGMPTMTEKGWQYADSQLKKYFKDLEIIGWVFVQPGFEDYISERICSFQTENYSRGLNLLYLSDPVENVQSLYQWDNMGNVFKQIKGYIVYYEKNEGMHEYMLDNKLDPVPEPSTVLPKPEVDAGSLVREITNGKHIKRKSLLGADQKQLVNLLGGVSFVMLLVCFVMGAGLIQNDERITQLQAQLDELKAAQSVFASQSVTHNTTTTTLLTTTTTEHTTETTTAKRDSYKVAEGDTLIKICNKVYGSLDKLDEIRELNNIENDKIVVGKKLQLP